MRGFFTAFRMTNVSEARGKAMKRHIVTSVLYTLMTAVLLGIGYPLVVTGLAHVIFPKQADGSLITKNGVVVGSHLIGQPFSGPGYFWSRPSAAGTGYDAGNSGGSNLAPSSAALATRVAGTVQTLNPKGTNPPVPIDLATASASGLDPDRSEEHTSELQSRGHLVCRLLL